MGQVTQVSLDGLTCGYSYNSHGDLTNASWSTGFQEAFDYTSQGEVVGRNSQASAQFERESHVLDGLGRKSSSAFTIPGGFRNHSYSYDLIGQLTRSQRQVQTGAGSNIWDGDQVLKEYNANGTVKANYFLGLGREAIKTGGNWYLYLNDTHGSVTGLLDTAGNGVASYTFGGYGETLTEQGSVYNPYRWNGEQLDAESGLVYLRNRYYQPSTGRFMQRDPIGYEGGFNLYAFCGGDPINASDPSGLEPAPFPFMKGGNLGPIWRRDRPRLIEHFQEGVTPLGPADHMVAGMMVQDLRFMGKAAGGFIAIGETEAAWHGAGKLVRGVGSREGTAQEEAFAASLVRAGKHVETRFGREGIDLIVEGAEWEFKGLTGNGQNTLMGAIQTAVKRNGASRVFIDAAQFELDESFVTATMNRLHGAGVLSKIDDLYIYSSNAIYRYNYH